MKLKNESLKEISFWEKAGIELPQFNREEMIAATLASPQWVHFGAGNIFRAYQAALAQILLNDGYETTGIITAEEYDGEIIEKCYAPFDNLSILVTLKSDGTTEKKVIASVADALAMDTENGMEKLKKIFTAPTLQMASFTITEKGYSQSPNSFLECITTLLYERYLNGAYPVAMVSMDNCSHNGDVLFAAIESIADSRVKNGNAEKKFLGFLRDKNKVSFPWTMIDKITPWPDDNVRDMLTASGLEDMQAFITAKKTYIAPFVNAEETQYLVIEDDFPNGRPALEKAGVLFTNRLTVEKTEKMKVCTCLNPLHTALSIFGTLLGYTLVRDAMKDADLVNLIKGIGYKEGLPVVTDPGIINPKEFLKEVIETRLVNPFMPDTLHRIAMDSSLKIPIRFGETLKAHLPKEEGKKKKEKSEEPSKLSLDKLKFIPLVFAGWLRYLLGVDDDGNPYEISPDPNNESLLAHLTGITLNGEKEDRAIIHEKLKPILSNPLFFGVNLYEAGLGDKVEELFVSMLPGGAVKAVLSENLA